MLRWPDRETVDRAARQWAREQAQHHPELLRLGYFGSYARGDWGVGSDLDLVAIVRQARRPFLERALDWDLRPLPVPAELRVYTEAEWQEMLDRGDRYSRTLDEEVRWIWPPQDVRG